MAAAVVPAAPEIAANAVNVRDKGKEDLGALPQTPRTFEKGRSKLYKTKRLGNLISESFGLQLNI